MPITAQSVHKHVPVMLEELFSLFESSLASPYSTKDHTHLERGWRQASFRTHVAWEDRTVPKRGLYTPLTSPQETG